MGDLWDAARAAIPLARQLQATFPSYQSDRYQVLIFPPIWRGTNLLGLPLTAPHVSLLVEEATIPEVSLDVETVTFPIRLEYVKGRNTGPLNLTFVENEAFMAQRLFLAWWKAMWHENGGLFPPSRWRGAMLLAEYGKVPMAYSFQGVFPKQRPAIELSHRDSRQITISIPFGYTGMIAEVLTNRISLTE